VNLEPNDRLPSKAIWSEFYEGGQEHDPARTELVDDGYLKTIPAGNFRGGQPAVESAEYLSGLSQEMQIPKESNQRGTGSQIN
jgi:hypothetical protein